jgi:hypothetical protein
MDRREFTAAILFGMIAAAIAGLDPQSLWRKLPTSTPEHHPRPIRHGCKSAR